MLACRGALRAILTSNVAEGSAACKHDRLIRGSPFIYIFRAYGNFAGLPADPSNLRLDAAMQPVILLGMHRSGTAMIARLLDELGLFQGHELQEDHESVWFLNVNDLMLRRINAAWDHPAPLRDFLQNTAAFDLTCRALHEDMSSRLTRPFLGTRRALQHKTLLKFDRPWGWKDPRTIFTLPLWLQLFPEAKIVYIIRNGVDVARSLAVREQRELDRRIAEFDTRKSAGSRSKLQRAGFKGSARCLTLEGGFSLWEEYVEEAERLLGLCNNPRLTIRFETFVADPAGGLPALAKFCGLHSGESALVAALDRVKVNPARANAAAADPATAAFYERSRRSRWMQHYGYGG